MDRNLNPYIVVVLATDATGAWSGDQYATKYMLSTGLGYTISLSTFRKKGGMSSSRRQLFPHEGKE